MAGPSSSATKRKSTATSHSNDAATTTGAQRSNRHNNKSAVVVVAQMVVCVLGIYGCFALWSLKQERVATQTYDLGGTLGHQRFKSPFVLNMFQNVCASFVAAALMVLSRQPLWPPSTTGPGATPCSKSSWIPPMLLIGFSCTFASPFGYAAMNRLSYPIVLTAKMCKLVPVMLVGFVWHRARYSAEKYWTVAFITSGVIAFSLLEEKHERADTGRERSSIVGLGLVAVNLLLDGFTCSSQDALVRNFGWNGNRVMLSTNVAAVLWGTVTLAALEFLPATAVSRPELSASIAFFAAQPAALLDVALMGLTNALGQFFIFQTIALFGSLTVTAMTLVRKIGSVLLSIYINDHQVSPMQWGALAAVIAGIVLETRININEKSSKHQHHHHHKHQQPSEVAVASAAGTVGKQHQKQQALPIHNGPSATTAGGNNSSKAVVAGKKKKQHGKRH